MKQHKLFEGSNSLEHISARLQSIFDICRTETIISGSGDYLIILFLISVYKDGILSKKIESKNIDQKTELSKSVIDYANLFQGNYSEILPVFMPTINRLSEDGIKAILQNLAKIDRKILNANFAEVFDMVLYRIAKSEDKRGGEYVSPQQLSALAVSLADLPENSKVFNPFAGMGSLAVNLQGIQQFHGQELNTKTWAVGKMRLMAYGIADKFKLTQEDSIRNWPPENDNYDLIVSFPPLGVRIQSQYKDVETDARTIEEFIIRKSLGSITKSGKIILLLPLGFLFRGGSERRLRQLLVNEDLIDTIISLPRGILFNTGIPTVMMVLKKTKKIPGEVRFIDASSFVNIVSSRERTLNIEKLNNLLKGRIQAPDTIRNISNEQIVKFDYNLNVRRYFTEEIDGVKLGELLEFVRGQRGPSYTKGKLVRVRDLKDDIFDFKLDISNVETSKFSGERNYLLKDTCLLLASRWKSLKPTLFDYNGEPIFRSQDVLSFKVNESKVDTMYLINELHADYVQKQLDSYRMGISIPYIRREDLLKVTIKLPPLKEALREILDILDYKKNIILQGPPGTGKTFIAKRLAYLKLKSKDKNRVQMIQFHQSYSYEDFIQGYRPNEDGGFKLANGIFYSFCQKAQSDPDNKYYFIIDEINRGNLSKIFGELMMLIEHDKRGKDFAIPLTYSKGLDDTFYIPKNIHLIGTMNTADRSLAMVDYALRRRFAFIDMEPNFDAKFEDHLVQRNIDKSIVEQITYRIPKLNKIIAEDPNLGKGFKIGHSYFCINNEDDLKAYTLDKWYRPIIKKEIGPQLREYWFDKETKAEDETKKLLE